MYYSAVHTADGRSEPIRAHSIDSLLPLAAFAAPTEKLLEQLPALRERMERCAARPGDRSAPRDEFGRPAPAGRRLMWVFGRQRLERLLPRLLDEAEFLS